MANVQAVLDPVHLQQTAENLLGHASWSRSELLEHQGRQLRSLLSTTIEHSSWYERSIGELVNRQRPLSEFPVMTKEILMSNFDEIVLDKRITLAGVEDHLSGANWGERYLGKYTASRLVRFRPAGPPARVKIRSSQTRKNIPVSAYAGAICQRGPSATTCTMAINNVIGGV